MSRVGSINGGFSGLSSFGKPGTSGNRAYFGQQTWSVGSALGFYSNDASMPAQDYYGGGYSVSWVVPANVTSISIVCIGAGGGACYQDTYVVSAGGGGGGLAYENNVAVTPGETLTLTYGRGRLCSSINSYGAPSSVWRGFPFFNGSTLLCGAAGGGSGSSPTAMPNLSSIPGNGGITWPPGVANLRVGSGYYVTSERSGSGTTATGGYGQGGQGGSGQGGSNPGAGQPMNGGGGAGGYGGTGGIGGGYYTPTAGAGAQGGGGGGGRGNSKTSRGGAGGGTSPYGKQGNGAAGVTGNPGTRGGGGSLAYTTTYVGKGSDWGGGGGGVTSADVSASGGNGYGSAGSGGNGIIRIIWPGTSRSFPSINTQDM
jgi:hypothetical protein